MTYWTIIAFLVVLLNMASAQSAEVTSVTSLRGDMVSTRSYLDAGTGTSSKEDVGLRLELAGREEFLSRGTRLQLGQRVESVADLTGGAASRAAELSGSLLVVTPQSDHAFRLGLMTRVSPNSSLPYGALATGDSWDQTGGIAGWEFSFSPTPVHRTNLGLATTRMIGLGAYREWAGNLGLMHDFTARFQAMARAGVYHGDRPEGGNYGGGTAEVGLTYALSRTLSVTGAGGQAWEQSGDKKTAAGTWATKLESIAKRLRWSLASSLGLRKRAETYETSIGNESRASFTWDLTPSSQLEASAGYTDERASNVLINLQESRGGRLALVQVLAGQERRVNQTFWQGTVAVETISYQDSASLLRKDILSFGTLVRF